MRSSTILSVALAALAVVCLTGTLVNGTTIVSQLQYTNTAGSQCAAANFVYQTNWTAGTCVASQYQDTSTAYYCNADGSYAYIASWTGATCDGTPASLQRIATGCGVLSYSVQYQCISNTGPYLPPAFVSWPPGSNWAITTNYQNLTSGKRLSICPSDTSGLGVIQSASHYGYCQRTSSQGSKNGNPAVYDSSQYITCPNSASVQYSQLYAGSTTCESSKLAVILQSNVACQDGYSSQCGSDAGGATASIQIGVKAIFYDDGVCGTTTTAGVAANSVCFNGRTTACVDQSGTTVVVQKRYSDALCQNLTATDTYQQNVCTVDPEDKTSSYKFSCFADGGGIGGIGSASTIGISVFSMAVAVVMAFFGAARSF